MIDVKAVMNEHTEGFYKPNGFCKQSAKVRRDFLEELIDSLDGFIPMHNDMSLDMLKNYNDLRGNIMWLIDKENENVRYGE